jgi:phosphoribosylanthranilate isomerase
MKNNRYFTKFCGITSIEDGLNAQSSGCDALGFVFVKKSKRYISTSKCQSIINRLSPTILTVALFANNTAQEIQEVLNKCTIHVLQFHGNEPAEFCRQWNRPYWKAIPMADGVNAIAYASNYADASAYLIDNYGCNKSGGSGSQFDWSQLPKDLGNKWILAGGLNPANITKAKQQTIIKCFDVSSGIEKAPGIKCKNKMTEFIKRLND